MQPLVPFNLKTWTDPGLCLPSLKRQTKAQTKH